MRVQKAGLVRESVMRRNKVLLEHIMTEKWKKEQEVQANVLFNEANKECL